MYKLQAEVSEKTYNRLRQISRDAGISLGKYISLLVEQAVTSYEKDNRALTREDQDKIKARLKALGYMD